MRQDYKEVFGGAEIPVPVKSIAEDLLGLAVAEAPLEGASGLLYPAERRIVVNAHDVAMRRRFTLAHELGHWICHCAGAGRAPVYCRAEDLTLDPQAKALEREANVFAAELLMPDPELRARFKGSAAEAAATFEVSPEAMSWRLYNLGLVDDRPV